MEEHYKALIETLTRESKHVDPRYGVLMMDAVWVIRELLEEQRERLASEARDWARPEEDKL